MTETLLLGWMAAIGLALLRPLWERLEWGLAGTALPVGAALYVGVSLALLAIGVRFSTVTALVVGSAVAIVVLAATRTSTPPLERRTITIVGMTLLTVVVLALGLHVVDLTRLTVDSMRYLLTADVLETTGGLELADSWDVRMRHLVVPLLHTAGVVAGNGYSAAITPLFALSGIAVTGWIAWGWFERSATPRAMRWWLFGSVGLLVVSANRFMFHAFYINGHMFAGVFIVMAVGLTVRAIISEDWALIVPAALSFAALAPLRPDGVITGAVFLVPLLVVPGLPRFERWRLLAPYVVATVLWNGVVWPRVAGEADLGLAGPVYGNVMIAVGVAIGLGLASVPQLARIAQRAPLLLAAGLAAYVAISVLDDSDVLQTSLEAMGANVAVEGLWGTFWWVMPPLLVAAWVLLDPSSRAGMLFASLPIYALAILAFAYLREGAYRVGNGDSANRMLVHLVFLVALAILAAAAESTSEPWPRGHPDPG